MIIVGLTGPSGSGKTTLIQYLASETIAHIDCDLLARKAVEKGTKCLSELVEVFGEEILLESGELNRKALAQIAFSTPQNTQTLNNITLPHIVKLIEKDISKFKAQEKTAVILDAPTLIEAGLVSICDFTVCLFSSAHNRKKRLQKRDNLPLEQLEARLRVSKSEEFYKQNCDIMIYNDSSESDLFIQSKIIIERIRKEN